MSDKKIEPVVFFSKEHANTSFLIRRNEAGYKGKLPFDEAPTRPSDIVAKFTNGMCVTDAPEVMKFLDHKPGVWRSDDKLGPIKLEFGEEVVNKFLKAFGLDAIDPSALSQALAAAGVGSLAEREESERAVPVGIE